VLMGDHYFTSHPYVYPHYEMKHPAFSPRMGPEADSFVDCSTI